MTPQPRLIPTALLACMLMTAACAGARPKPAPPPRLTLPETAARPCRLPILPSEPTLADLETGYMARGAALVECDEARRLAVAAWAALNGSSRD